MMAKSILSSLALVALFFFSAVFAARCINLSPYEPILNGLIDAIPSREIQDSLPLPLTLNNGGEVWRKRIELWLCDLDIIMDQVTIQVLNVNWEKIELTINDRENVFITVPTGVQLTARIHGDCGIYKPKIVTQIEFANTFSASADLCIDMAAITDPTNILNYTAATVQDINYKPDSQVFYWCIYDALPLLEAIIHDAISDAYDDIWRAVNDALANTLLPGLEDAVNGALRAIGIPPYNATEAERAATVPTMFKAPPRKLAEKISVIRTGNFSSLMYNDKGSSAWMDGSFYRPSTTFAGYYPVGDYAQRNYNSPNGVVMMVRDDGNGLVAKPTGYERVWHDKGSRADLDGSFWRPVPPSGYTAIGHLSQRGYDAPSTDSIRVIRNDCVVRCDPWLSWTDRCSSADSDVSIWTIAETTSPSTGVLVSHSSYSMPTGIYYCIHPDCIKLEN